MANLRDKILNAKDIKSEVVEVPEWNVKVEVRGLTGAQRATLLKECIDRHGNVDFEKMYPLLLIATVYDPENGEQVFTPADRDSLNKKSGGALEKVAKVAMKLSGLEQGAVAEKAKN